MQNTVIIALHIFCTISYRKYPCSSPRNPGYSCENCVGFLVIPADSVGFLVIPADSLGFLVIPADSLGFLVIPADSLGFLVIPADP